MELFYIFQSWQFPSLCLMQKPASHLYGETIVKNYKIEYQDIFAQRKV